MHRHVVEEKTHVIPFPGATDTQFRIARCFSLLNKWHAAIAGHSDMDEMIALLTRQTSARSISMYRYKDGRAGHIAAAARAIEGSLAEKSRGTLAQYLRETRTDTITAGSTWNLRTLRKEDGFADSPAGREWNARSDILDVTVVVLEKNHAQMDVFEMIFDSVPKTNADVPPKLVIQALADAWVLRAPGLISRTIIRNSRSRARPEADASSHILSNDNPCGLSRAEQRVCQLLIMGKKAKEIAEFLDLSIPTVRTHLRNIYAKTNTSGQVELIALAYADGTEAA